MAPSTSSKIKNPTRIDIGRPTKKTCICGIRRESTPSPRLNSRPNTTNGAESWMPMLNAVATVRVVSAATSPRSGISPGWNSE